MRTRRSRSSSDSVPSRHRSVLLDETIEALALQEDDCVVDCTVGAAGHARAITEKLGKKGTYVGIDADERALLNARQTLGRVCPKAVLVHTNFRTLKDELPKH